MKCFFHEIKVLSLKNRALTSKLEEMKAKGTTQNTAEVVCTEENMRLMVEHLQQNVELIDKMKKDNEVKVKFLEGEISKIKDTMKTIMENNHKIAKHNATIMSTMVERTKKFPIGISGCGFGC